MKTPDHPHNSQEDERIFTEAIARTSISEIPVEFDESSTQKLADSINLTKIFILGETHGVKENADIIYTLFKKFGFGQLALEWEPELKRTVEQFIQTGEVDFKTIEDSPDGRITAGHFTLIKKLHEEGLLKSLICFSNGGATWNERDATMAAHIMEQISDTPTLVIAGNLHTQLESIIFDDKPDIQHPMGEHIKNKIPDVPSGEITYRTGEFYNYGIQQFSDTLSDQTTLSEARFYQNEVGTYVFELPEAHTAVVPNSQERL